IDGYTRTRIHRAKPPTVGEFGEAPASGFLDKLRATLQKGAFGRKDHLIERLMEEGFSSTDIASALIHHLQTGDGAAAVAQPAGPSRDEPPRYERQERHERYERPERPDRREQRSFQKSDQRSFQKSDQRPF